MSDLLCFVDLSFVGKSDFDLSYYDLSDFYFVDFLFVDLPDLLSFADLSYLSFAGLTADAVKSSCLSFRQVRSGDSWVL